MIFTQTKLSGCYIIELEIKKDSRGFFARSYCSVEMEKHGITFNVEQTNISHSVRKGTLRGMHYHEMPVYEPKIIRCIRGVVWDVVIDMRPDSMTFLQHTAIELSADNGKSIYVPHMFAHGHQSLADNTDLLYLMGASQAFGFEKGIRYNDPVIGIDWPAVVDVINERDANWPLLCDSVI